MNSIRNRCATCAPRAVLPRRLGALAPWMVICLLMIACTAQPRFTSTPGSQRPAPRAQAAAKTTPSQAAEYRAGQVLRGSASWYGPGFHGRKTASGEVFNMNALSAAHRELPLGTWLQVKNLANGRKVEVLVNDRGPYKTGRILDLSREAARKLDFLEAGTAEIEARILTLP